MGRQRAVIDAERLRELPCGGVGSKPQQIPGLGRRPPRDARKAQPVPGRKRETAAFDNDACALIVFAA